jgi:hemerythrin
MSSAFQLPKIGIQEIDDQHAQLVLCLDRLELWVGKGQGFAATLDALSSLNDYVEKHFTFEEALLRQRGYQKLDEHIEEHRQISAELARLTKQVLDGGDIDQELLDLIRKWIITHIGVEDVAYAIVFAGQQA